MVQFDAINEVLREYNGSFSYYYDKNIPSKKLVNARITMCVPSSAKIYALYDATLFGSAKEGACFTNEGIYFKSGSTVGMLKYDNILSGIIEGKKIDGKYFDIFIWCPGLIEKIKRVNEPISMTEAQRAMADENYSLVLQLLDKQEKYLRNTSIEDTIIYKHFYIDAYIGLKDYGKAEELLKSFAEKYRANAVASELITKAETQISEYKERYKKDLQVLSKVLKTCKSLQSEQKYGEAIELLEDTDIRDDFDNKIKREYAMCLIESYLLDENADGAEEAIEDLHEDEFIDDDEMNSLMGRVRKLREVLHKRFVEEKRKYINEQIDGAKLYERYGVFESASDILVATMSNTPDELVDEKVNLFKLAAEMLMNQYEYDTIINLSKQYSSVSSAEKLGYVLSEQVEQHKSEHTEEYFEKMYQNLLYYIQNGKFERAEYYMNNAKAIKNTFELRCSEINLEILKLSYVKSRKLIDCLITDKAMYENDLFVETIEQLEEQYRNMINSISEMLKVLVINNSTETLSETAGYEDFVDEEGLNLPSIAARFANHDFIDMLANSGYDYKFKHTNEGFGIAFLAALQMDIDAFTKFISARMDNFAGDISCVFNEKMNYTFEVSEVIRELQTLEGMDEEKAKTYAIETAFNEAVFFVASLLDDNTRRKIKDNLLEKKQMQENLVKRMRMALPDELRLLEQSTTERCENLNKALEDLNALLLDVPETEDVTKTEVAMKKLRSAINEAIKYAESSAESKKAAKEKALADEEDFIDIIESCHEAFGAIDKSEIISLLMIPAAAIRVEAYNEKEQTMIFTLMGQKVEVTLDSKLASQILSNSQKVQVSEDVQFEYIDKKINIKHIYVYSDGREECCVIFDKIVTISDELTEDKFVDRLLGAIDY